MTRRDAKGRSGAGQAPAATPSHLEDPMTPESVGPLSRPVSVAHLPPEGVEETVEATAEERAALAADFKLPAIHALTGCFRLAGSDRRVTVTGTVQATITQICVVTLEPFDSLVEEEVEVEFAAPHASGLASGPDEPPDPIVNGEIDLGSITAEFLALGLNPYPKKPGVSFSYAEDEDPSDSRFAALSKLKLRE